MRKNSKNWNKKNVNRKNHARSWFSRRVLMTVACLIERNYISILDLKVKL